MLENLRISIGYWLFRNQWHRISEKEKDIDMEINRRVAGFLLSMDPFEPLMRRFGGIFANGMYDDDRVYEKPEARLDERSKYNLTVWAYQQHSDPSFRYLMDWLINTQANATLKTGNPTPETILYGRAQISAPILIKKEVSRLASVYEEFLRKQRGEGNEFNSDISVE